MKPRFAGIENSLLAGLDQKLFASFNKQLSERGLIVGKGTIVDATIKESPGHTQQPP